jgi:predicted GNAT superfamily acetyltransferase
MTETDLVTPGARSPADRAQVDAAAAARSAGVSVREVTRLEEFEAVERLYAQIWGRDSTPPLSTELLRAFAKTGNYVAGAFDGGRLVGACVGFFSAPADVVLHSHITGVASSVRGRNVGYALKLHQRAWALRRGVPVIAWTFDPLVSRNAWFNVVKLAGVPVEYLPNFYGTMHDGINQGEDSDRLLVHWELDRPEVAAASAGHIAAADAVAERAGGAVVALGASASGAPVPGPLDAATSLVAVPPDIEAMRAGDPGLAREWRAAMRDVLGTLMADGGRITGFAKAGWYIVSRTAALPHRNDDGRS